MQGDSRTPSVRPGKGPDTVEGISYPQEVSPEITWPQMGLGNTLVPDESTALDMIKNP